MTSPDVVHLWQAHVDREAGEVARLRALLSPGEVQRADRFRFARDRDAFVVTRAVRRQVLAHHTGQDPRELTFLVAERGKPFIPDGPEFNQSDSGTVTLIAVGHTRRVGVDVEQLRDDVDCERLAARFFSPAEQAALRRLPAELRRRGFFACWSRKEAFIKAQGTGLSAPLHAFDVSVHPDGPAELLATRPDPDEAARWRLRAVDAPPGYAAALAVETSTWQLVQARWPDASTASSL